MTLILTQEARNTLKARAWTKVLALIRACGQSFHGVASSIRDSPRDDLALQKSTEAEVLSKYATDNKHHFLIEKDLTRRYLFCSKYPMTYKAKYG